MPASPCISVCCFYATAAHSITDPKHCPRKPPRQEKVPVASSHPEISHLEVYFLHMSSAAGVHHNSMCAICYSAVAIFCPRMWQNTPWWLLQSQAKTAEAEGSATKPGYLLFIIQFPDWWVHKPAAKCCVLYCQQTNALNGRQGE